MIEPQKNWQLLVRKRERERVGAMNAEAFSVIFKLYKMSREQLKSIFGENLNERALKSLEKAIEKRYKSLFALYGASLINALNQSTIEQRWLIVNTLGREPRIPKVKFYDALPKTDQFAITRRILSEKSVLNRSKRLARRAADVIRDSHEKGRTITETAKLLEVEYGLRDRLGRKLTPRAKDLLKRGLFAHSNGQFYTFYRIARTESMRMASIQSNNTYKDLVKRESGARLKMVSVLDSRTRPQSVEMNGQISRKDGKFKYPNGYYYQHGEAPARYSISDRETTITVFLDEINKGGEKFASPDDYKRSL